MKRIIINLFKFTYEHSIRHRVSAWLAGLALSVLGIPGHCLAGELIGNDTFDKYPEDITSQSPMRVADGQAVLLYTITHPTPTNDLRGSAQGSAAGYMNWHLPLQKGTMELRIDWINANQDDLFLMLGLDSGGYRDYGICMDRNEITVWKIGYSPAWFMSFFSWDSITLPSNSVTLSVAFTPCKASPESEASLEIHVRVLDKARQNALIYDRTIYDTPGQDELVPSGSVKGFKVDPEGIPAPYIWSMIPCLGVIWFNPDHGPTLPAEITVDNFQVLEYGIPKLEIAKTVCLTWPEDTLEDQIVVAADSLPSSVWTPWPEPIFKRNGQLCLTIETADEQRFFKLVPGIQFSDDFNPPPWPYMSKGEWALDYKNTTDATRLLVTNLFGTWQFRALEGLSGSCLLTPPGPAIMVGDYSASLDILDWEVVKTGQVVSIGARMSGYDASTHEYAQGCWGSVRFREGNAYQAVLELVSGGKSVKGPLFPFTPAKNYRLCFSGVGSTLSLRICDVANPAEPVSEVQLTDAPSSPGSVLLAVGLDSATSRALTLDNFFVTGTKP